MDFDFDEWRQLAEQDPDGFESRRRAVLEETIRSAPEKRRARLRGLQWRIDQERARAATPLASCMRLSRMLLDSLHGEYGLINAFRSLEDSRHSLPLRQAEVISLPRRSPPGQA